MRQIMLDTETTGLEYRLGDRVIEIGCVEMIGRKLTQRRFHAYLNPDRPVDPGAQAIHGLTDEFLADKPRFADIVDEWLEFIRDAELIIHNASFDVGFLNNELALLAREPLTQVTAGVVDSLRLARDMHPGRKNSLDALCERYGVDNSNRQIHGALLDAELLAEVYLAMTRGQESLVMDLGGEGADAATHGHGAADLPPLRVLRASDEELAEHQQVLAAIQKESKGNCLWLAAEPATAPS